MCAFSQSDLKISGVPLTCMYTSKNAIIVLYVKHYKVSVLQKQKCVFTL